MATSDLRGQAAFQLVNPVGMRWRGDWDPATLYQPGDTVYDLGDTFTCINSGNSLNEQPSVSPLAWTQVGGSATGSVQSLNSGVGNLVLAGANGLTVSPVVGNTITLTQGQTVTQVNPGAGITVSGPVTSPTISNAGVRSLNGLTGTPSVTAGAGISVATGGGNVVVTNTGVLNPMTSNLNANNFSITTAATVNTGVLETEQIALKPGSLQTEIQVRDHLLMLATKEIRGQAAATIVGASGASLTTTGGNTTVTAPTGTVDITGGAGASVTATAGQLTLSTTGANDVWVYPGSSGGLHIFSQNGNPSANPEFKIENQNGNPKGAYMKLYKNSASPANGDEGGTLSFHANNSLGADTEIAEIATVTTTVAAGAEAGEVLVKVQQGGAGLSTGLTVVGDGIKPAAIYDTVGMTRGLANQVLTSTGTGLSWLYPFSTNLTGMTATSTGSTNPNGVQFVENGTLYTAHVFLSGAGTFNITNNGNQANPTIDILAIGGGGAGGGGTSTNGGGGGCGNVLTLYDFPTTGRTELDPFTPVVPTPGSPFTFNISVGVGGTGVAGAVGDDGDDSTVTCPAEVAVAWYVNNSPALVINASGGGGGGAGTGGGRSGRTGYNYYLLGSNPTLTNTLAGAGGGAGAAGANTNTGNANYGWSGYRGGLYGESFVGGGFRGGSGSAVGVNSGGGGGGCRGGGYGAGVLGLSTLTCAPGGPGIELSFDGSPRYVGGGGEAAASNRSATVQSGAYFGGGFGYQATGAVLATDGVVNTGGGGGGASATTKPGDGGSGLVIIRYRT